MYTEKQKEEMEKLFYETKALSSLVTMLGGIVQNPTKISESHYQEWKDLWIKTQSEVEKVGKEINNFVVINMLEDPKVV